MKSGSIRTVTGDCTEITSINHTHTDSDDNSESQSLGAFLLVLVVREHVPLRRGVHDVCARQPRRVVPQKGQRSATPRRTDGAKAASPTPSLSPSSFTLMLSWDVSLGDGFPGNRLLSALRG